MALPTPVHAVPALLHLYCRVCTASRDVLCSATGFVFQLHPADSRITPATPLGTPGGSAATVTPRSTRRSSAAAAAAGDSMPGMEDSSDYEEEEEVTFVPISLGTAEASMPEYLKVGGLSA